MLHWVQHGLSDNEKKIGSQIFEKNLVHVGDATINV